LRAISTALDSLIIGFPAWGFPAWFRVRSSVPDGFCRYFRDSLSVPSRPLSQAEIASCTPRAASIHAQRRTGNQQMRAHRTAEGPRLPARFLCDPGRTSRIARPRPRGHVVTQQCVDRLIQEGAILPTELPQDIRAGRSLPRVCTSQQGRVDAKFLGASAVMECSK
jgi:hypothetical protein